MPTSHEECSTLKGSQIVESLRWRYATKKFNSEKRIPEETWKELEETLILSPSSFGLQPWSFVVVSDQKIKDRLPEFSWSQNQVKDCSHLVVICRRNEMNLSYVDRFVEDIAATRGVSTDSLKSYHEMMAGFVSARSAAELETWMTKQCYIALGVLMTAASLLKVDNCPMEGFLPAEYDRILGLESKGLKSVVLCALGYRADDDKYAKAAKVRFKRDEIVIRV